MFCTVDTQDAQHASLASFSLLRPRRLTGVELKDVENLQNSILRHGLLSPITVVTHGTAFIVVDGRKRLAAIRRLAFEGRLPRSLTHIPYRLADRVRDDVNNASVLLNNRELYVAMSVHFADGYSPEQIAGEFHVSRQCVRDAMTLDRLSLIIREAFFSRLIDFSQARAYASLPDKADQLSRFRALGPFASATTILDYTKSRRACDRPALSIVAA